MQAEQKELHAAAADPVRLRGVLAAVAALNLAYFAVEFGVALGIGSVSLFADSIDFLEDASLSFLIVVALDWSAVWRARLGMALAGVLLLPALATVWALWNKYATGTPPAAVSLSLTGLGALAVNLACAVLLARHQSYRGSLTRAAFLSARNDVVANVAIVAAGLLTAATRSPWPDVLVGLGIAGLNASAARTVWRAARQEQHVSRAGF